MDASYRQRYGELYRRHWWWRAREAAILSELRRLRPPAGWRRLLDVGCGDGLLFDRLAAFGEVEGVEPDVSLLSPDSKWRSRIHAVPFDPAFRPVHRYDVVLFLDVLEHLERPDEALRHAATLLMPGGLVVVTVPAFEWLWTSHDDLNHHLRRYDRPAFRRLAAAAAFRLIRERYLFQWVVPAKLLVRGWEALRHPRPAPPRIPSRPVNAALYALCRLEQAVSARLTVPIGGSLLVIATPV